MRAEEMVALYTLLVERGVRVWVDGGWGIDALLEEQTRPHKDFDALVPFDDLGTLAGVLAGRGFTLKETWEENRWVAHAVRLPLIGREHRGGSDVATAFVLRNGAGHELDVHVLTFDSRGYGIPAWNADVIFPPDALAGRGVIAGTPVRCLSAPMQMATHTGYALQAKDLRDLRLLHERFGIAYLAEQAHPFPRSGT
jgi:lincosamide nucleotidyltransferase A/C/D/E